MVAKRKICRVVHTRQARHPLRKKIANTDLLPASDPHVHHHISTDTRDALNIYEFIDEYRDDPACEASVQFCSIVMHTDPPQDFLTDLKSHLWLRLTCAQMPDNTDYRHPTEDEAHSVYIEANKMYIHSVFRVNFTTYDMRRDQDSINPSRHADIVLLAPEGSDHPYLYARVASIFHVKAALSFDHEPQIHQVLWVRWFDIDKAAPGGFEKRRLHRLKFADIHGEKAAFGFVAPDQVLRGAHVMPAEQYGRSDTSLPGRSIGRSDDDTRNDNKDWKYYFTGM